MANTISRKLPKRTGKDSKRLRMNTSHTNSETQHKINDVANQERHDRNNQLLNSAVLNGVITDLPKTKTERRKLLAQLHAARNSNSLVSN